MAFLINLSGSGFGTQTEKDGYFDNSKKNIEENAPGRFGLFVNVDFESIDEVDYAKNQTDVIRDAVKKGAIGLKIYKSLGLRYKDKNGKRILTNPNFSPWQWQEFGYMTSSIRSLIKSIETCSELAVSGHDLRQALEIAIAMKLSAQKGNIPIKLPLVDRTHTLIPEIYRWIGGDQTGNIQSVEEASKDLDM